MHLNISSVKWEPFCPEGDEWTLWLLKLEYSLMTRPLPWLLMSHVSRNQIGILLNQQIWRIQFTSRKWFEKGNMLTAFRLVNSYLMGHCHLQGKISTTSAISVFNSWKIIKDANVCLSFSKIKLVFERLRILIFYCRIETFLDIW